MRVSKYIIKMYNRLLRRKGRYGRVYPDQEDKRGHSFLIPNNLEKHAVNCSIRYLGRPCMYVQNARRILIHLCTGSKRLKGSSRTINCVRAENLVRNVDGRFGEATSHSGATDLSFHLSHLSLCLSDQFQRKDLLPRLTRNR